MGKEIDYDVVFGTDTAGQDAGGDEAEAGASDDDGQNTAGAQDHGIDQGAQAPEGDADTGADIEKDGKPAGEGRDGDGGKKPELTPDERSKNAERRRRQEAAAQARIEEAARKRADEAVDAVIKDMGLTDPFTKKPITSKAEYDAYAKRRDEQMIEKGLKKSGLEKEALDKLIETHPDVVKAREAAKRLEQAEQKASEASGAAKIAEQIQALTELDPEVSTLGVKGVQDLDKLPNYDKIYEMVSKRGLSLLDAYKLANFDRLQAGTSAAAKQAALNAVSGKNHLQSDQSHGSGGVEVPADVRQMYRDINPGITDAEIKKSYAEYLKSKKG